MVKPSLAEPVITGSASEGFTITNTYDMDKVSVNVTKTWDHGDQPSANYPASVTVNLLADGVATGATLVLNAANSWTGSFDDLDKYVGGAEIVYTVTEDAVANYTPVITGSASAGFIITNTYNMEKVSVDVAKAWDHGDQPIANYPASVTVNLLANGVATGKTLTLNAGNNWTGSFDDLDKYVGGDEIVYSVTEDAVANYTPVITGSASEGFSITNTYDMETVDISGIKTWLGMISSATPDVTIALYKDGSPFATTPLVNDAYSFLNLPKYEAGSLINYEVQELTVPSGFTSSSVPNQTNGKDFTNTYKASGTLDLSGTKTFTGREGRDEDIFTFKLYENAVSDANLIDTQTVAGSGPYSFAPITYTLDLQATPAVNDLGDHTYIVVEEVLVPNPSAGITYDTTQYTVNVNVTDNGDGTLSVVVVSENATTLDFTNVYHATGSFDVDIDLNPTKVLAGRVLKDQEFAFVLKQGANTLQTVNNTADGNIPFAALNYTEADIGQTYEYTITETPGTETGMTYDPMVLTFSVIITDLLDGTLSATLVSQPEDTEFNNSYEASGEYNVDADLNPTKVLEGRTLKDQEFEFVLKQGDNVLQTVNNTADGNIPFAPLSYTQADIGQTYDYTIVETPGTETGMTYDPMVLSFSVTISDLGNGLLSAVLAGTSEDTEFNNSYEASGEYNVDADLNPTKVLEGRMLTDQEFEFVLKQGDNVLQTVNNTADGNIPFTPLSYTQADIGQTYDYTIVETPGTETGMTYDPMVLSFSVIISDLGNGLLSAVLAGTSEDTEFNNSYEASGEYNVDADLNPTKVLDNRALADQEFEFILRQGDNVLQTVNNTADGNIPFAPLSFTQDDIGQTYDYSITETAGTEIGMTYDAMILTFSVTVTDLGNGELSAVLAATPQDTEFNNSAPLTRYSILYFYRLSPDDPYNENTDYTYVSPLVAVGTQAGGFADRSENGFWQLVGTDGNRRVLVADETANVVRIYYQRAQVPLGGGAVINVGDASE